MPLKYNSSISLNHSRSSRYFIFNLAIIGFEYQLSSKVALKLTEFQKRLVYKKLRTNDQYIKNLSKAKKRTNSTYFQFMQHLTAKLKPLLNKSFVIARKNS